MKIGIIGAGSIGLLFAGYLAKNFDVTIFPHTEEQAKLINSGGITVRNRDSYFIVKVKATCQTKLLIHQDLVIIALKQYHLKTILSEINKIPHIPLLFLQNGMGHLPILNQLSNKNIIIGSVEHGASRVNDTIVDHNGMGKTKVSMYRGMNHSIEHFLFLNDKNFQFQYVADYESILTKKLLVNAMINPLTAILKVKNGELLSNPDYFRIVQELYNEIIPLYPHINKKTMISEIVQICKNTKENESSMLKDIKNGTKTEIDAILGVILNRGNERGIQLPITWSLYQMIKGMERKEEKT